MGLESLDMSRAVGRESLEHTKIWSRNSRHGSRQYGHTKILLRKSGHESGTLTPEYYLVKNGLIIKIINCFQTISSYKVIYKNL